MESSDWCELLRTAPLEVLGRMPWSSNATFLVEIDDGEMSTRGVYKPARGEQPLWDFPDGIYRREVATFELASQLGLRFVPETVVRSEAPYGEGSVQRFIDADYERHYFTLVEEPENVGALRVIAAFDLLINNADRKGGHLLIDGEGQIWAIDHGLCFHADPKLRTVMWDFAGEELPADAGRFAAALLAEGAGDLVNLLDRDEIDALYARAEQMIEKNRFPFDEGRRRSRPWPLV